MSHYIFLFYILTCLECWEKTVFSIDPCVTRMGYSAQVGSHPQDAWGGRPTWKVQRQHTEMQSACTCVYRDYDLCPDSGVSQVSASDSQRHSLWRSAAPLPSEQVQIKSCILSLNIFIETLKLRYLNYILAVLQEPCCPEPIDAYISRPNERQNGDGGINGSVPNFPQPPSSNQII